ncbi:MAG: hypothetical protein K5880_14160 [Hydrogenophaga sp.]|uniref:hypothetical protein n=1 Tax=Hydrogenophaga sp. TaxID=1904254 RepID=UPI0026117F3E|nr:hypothetical protein [Hydrogenophaga sp.]MCV0439767.1 hypothetical protein [Hydrogenophaga sp.]
MTNLYDWTNDVRRYFDSYGVLFAGAEMHSGMSFEHILGQKNPVGTEEQISVDIHLITEDFAAVEEALADGFLDQFELSLVSEERTHSFDHNTEVTLRLAQKEPQTTWVEL